MLDIIRKLCKEKHIPMVTLEKEAGLGMNTLIKWDRSTPSVDRVAAVADVLGVSVDELLGREVKPTPPDERELVRLYRELNTDGKAAAVVYLRFLGMQPAYIKSADAGEGEAV